MMSQRAVHKSRLIDKAESAGSRTAALSFHTMTQLASKHLLKIDELALYALVSNLVGYENSYVKFVSLPTLELRKPSEGNCHSRCEQSAVHGSKVYADQ
jgi:hypothetical protein